MEKLIASHTCEDESGQRYTVREYQNFIDASSHDGRGSIGEQKRYALSDGSPVNYVDGSTFKTVVGSVALRRIG